MSRRMTVQAALVSGYEFSPDKKLRKLHGQAVTLLCGSQFYNTATHETMRLDRDFQALICTEDGEYLAVDTKELIINHAYQKTGYANFLWNPCTPEKWAELHGEEGP